MFIATVVRLFFFAPPERDVSRIALLRSAAFDLNTIYRHLAPTEPQSLRLEPN